MLDGLQPVDVIFAGSTTTSAIRWSSGAIRPSGLPAWCRPCEPATSPSRMRWVGRGRIAGADAVSAAPLPPLLGEELRLPSVATWWCGEPKACATSSITSDTLVVKPARFRSLARARLRPRGFERSTGKSWSPIRARTPREFVGQEQVALSTAPVWLGHKLEPRPVVLRTYLAAAGDSFIVMPGGLTRVAPASDMPVVSMQRGGGSKDTWVLADGPVSNVSLLAPPTCGARLSSRGHDLPSRVADDLFWLGRYAERAEACPRLASKHRHASEL